MIRLRLQILIQTYTSIYIYILFLKENISKTTDKIGHVVSRPCLVGYDFELFWIRHFSINNY